MKKTRVSKSSKETDLLPEYRFNYRKAKPNRFAKRDEHRLVVIVDPDIAQVFTTPKLVNKALRALLMAVPKHER